ncbi:hypothetical protein SAMN05216420_11053 [Nitrosospira sp. Nl5]|uniref:hypothetical protein n=1 Tax=Nitrosospira sp. Nl5 TaxID=200120 RepID=UPI00088F812C|nr:hypothetical protein [Nitrosospira sp. Nl5]SCY61668.1 hypothetical protein SAMN05216420_11053 [Nitrosospira sp. Nl5]
MIRNPVDIATRVSPNLSALIESQVNDPDAEQPVTLATVRSFITGLLPSALSETEHLHHFDIDASLLDELEALIDEFGEDAVAIDFAQHMASEPLSRVIDAVINDENRENPPTLETVKNAIAGGLPAKLVGDGVLEDDEDDALLAEIEVLIRRYGADSLAEEFLRYE